MCAQEAVQKAPITGLPVDVDSSKTTMPKHNYPGVPEDDDRLLGEIFFAFDALSRRDLRLVAGEVSSLSELKPRRAPSDETETELREFLKKCAKRLRRRDPEKLISLKKYLLDFARSELKRAV